jgi:hypothetical protein
VYSLTWISCTCFSARVKYVDAEAHALARGIELKLARVAPEAGVLFVGVAAQPVEGGKSREFFVRLGIRRSFSEDAGRALIRQLCNQEIQAGMRILVNVFRGVSGADRDDGSDSAHPPAS